MRRRSLQRAVRRLHVRQTKEVWILLKLITFAVPCYNSAGYMERCLKTLVAAGDEAEIILVDDGSTDETGAIADRWAADYPGIIRVIHQENGGHGEGVNQGIRNASGLYFQVVDSDDWLDGRALQVLLNKLRMFSRMDRPIDLVICNYVYEHAADNTQHVVRYSNAMPVDRVFGWNEVGRFNVTQFITIHSAIYRTGVLRDCGLTLPKHTFYVDNLFVYQPLPSVHTLWYLDIDLYRYFIGRDDQSVSEENVIQRIDQHILVTRLLIDAHDLKPLEKSNRRLANYMYRHLSILMMICTIFLWKSGTRENQEKADALWDELRWSRPALYRRLRWRSSNICLLPGRMGHCIDLFVYRQLRKRLKFN
ncbi:MAG: glycosyltransferase [Clostridia bacterium]|nr:glycosyltransferase [Clostridia bacterium]